MSIEQYPNGVIVVAVADGPSDITVWLRGTAIMGLSPKCLGTQFNWNFSAFV
jgi:hypothetical protein